eukprot:Nitzschia sp. Nitz4//scaffold16_size188269//96486//104413//NITZ4_001795-RA/size188269-snap-gene-0.143-mRNA-1//-1//CDS//3329538529//129//frame0
MRYSDEENDFASESESDSFGGSSSRRSSSQESSRLSEKEELAIAKEEDKAVFRTRLAVGIFLLLCTIGTAALVYAYSRNRQEEEFKSALANFSTKVFGSLATTFDQGLAALDAYAVATASFAQATNATWPFVTVPNSGTRLAKVLSVSRSESISVVHKITNANREAWNEYSLEHAPEWLDENLRVQANFDGYLGELPDHYHMLPLWKTGGEEVDEDNPFYLPFWQSFPTPNISESTFNYDILPDEGEEEIDSIFSGYVELTDVWDPHGGYHYVLQGIVGNVSYLNEPVSEFHYPIAEGAANDVDITDVVGNESKVVAFLHSTFYWRKQMLNMLPPGVDGIVVVVSTSCGKQFTYEVNGPDVEFLGNDDYHDPKYDDNVFTATFDELRTFKAGTSVYSGLEVTKEFCLFEFRVYPSDKFAGEYIDNEGWILVAVAITIFVFTTAVFLTYDVLVERRQKKVMNTALKSSAIVSSLFPKNIRDRLFETGGTMNGQSPASQKHQLRSFISKEDEGTATGNDVQAMTSRPIADLFPEATVSFGDIANFTAWSSTREPSQVFILLETVYGAFDRLATKRGVFKVETIGDSYMSVAGLPDPRRDHAVIMAKFARDCILSMHKLMARLSIELGPDTEDLSMRFGLNSGPVTAGVLRGQKSRFQLFGDTVNTASRMESTGEIDRIQASPTTAEELRKHDKGHWLQARKDSVEVKGKGKMVTYWVLPREVAESSNSDKVDRNRVISDDLDVTAHPTPEELHVTTSQAKLSRLVEWNVDVLAKLLCSIIAHENAAGQSERDLSVLENAPEQKPGQSGLRPLDEVKEIIELPQFDQHLAVLDANSVQLDPNIKAMLRDYVSAIATTYHSENPFHNFEHASHVSMSVAKLMSRIVAADEFYEKDNDGLSIEHFKHNQTFGIASDPLTLFACAFSALIHDADHPGVPNTQLVKEETEDAKKYGNRSVAEQRSVDVAWELLMENRFTDLRKLICPTDREMRRFRELVVCSVMATDIMDKDLKQLRNARWDKAFDVSSPEALNIRDMINRKATIVMEHLIQASDVAHTMQHWHVYRKWNERLFDEMMLAYQHGRMERNPAEFWYKGELGFFDFYIIPLAKKLSDCGVFGVSSDEYLNYAMKNREEWEHKGEDVVAAMSPSEYSQPDESVASGGNARSLSTQDAPRQTEDYNIFANAENKAVLRSRIAVFVFLFLCAIAAATLVMIKSRRQEEMDMDTAFVDFGEKVFRALAATFDQSLAAIDAAAVAAVSYAADVNETWPFVTIPNSGTRFAKLLRVTKGVVCGIAPYVTHANRERWNEFSLSTASAWVDDNIRIQKNYVDFTGTTPDNYVLAPIWYDNVLEAQNLTYYFPFWQTFPTPASGPIPVINYDYSSPSADAFDETSLRRQIEIESLMSGKAGISDVVNANDSGGVYDSILQSHLGNISWLSEPASEIHYPIFSDASEDIFISDTAGVESSMVAFSSVLFYWRDTMLNMLPSGIEGIITVVSTSCGKSFTYQINGPDVEFLGFGDQHDAEFDDYALETDFAGLSDYESGGSVYSGLEVTQDICTYTFQLYPSKTFESKYISSKPVFLTIATVAIFFFTSGVFLLYDFLVERRQKRVMNAAMKSTAIVTSLFPKNVRDRLFEESNDGKLNHSSKHRLRNFMSDSRASEEETPMNDVVGQYAERPIADLFPSATVMFGDIANFTAWSSAREPSQVFILLESVYGCFDKLAMKRGVFKVETIGDSYVAVVGLPDPREDHAIVMAKFARDCGDHMNNLMTKLSVTLGPDTEDLTMRFGIHSGPVTAGVLRGQKSRFQLFGDTVNTASRMESTGQIGRIQASQATADELRNHDKGHWLEKREDLVEVKGKGKMVTFWVSPREVVGASCAWDGFSRKVTPSEGTSRASNDEKSSKGAIATAKLERLIEWNVDVLSRLLCSIIANRSAVTYGESDVCAMPIRKQTHLPEGTKIVRPLDEVKEIIELPEFDQHLATVNPESVQLDPHVKGLLREYVSEVAATYHSKNPFHNFEHASHVSMSVAKLMSRIVAADDFYENGNGNITVERFKHDRTFGIASDPLTLFACAFSALIHDADHPGVSNAQLVKEETEDAKKYGNRSVAEQRSVDIAWELLMERRFTELLQIICPTKKEQERFRELVVCSVMATDIMDKDLKQLRNARWDKAFDVSSPEALNIRDMINRKATIVMEHLIQASDVAHTMQHWHVFRKWNERLFNEMMLAHEHGRMEKNPADFWYQGELGFFDFYIIPLAKKLSDCGVFGVSSDEYLNYAMKNREEWEQKGKQVVVDMVKKWRASKRASSIRR